MNQVLTFLFTDIEGSTRLWEQHPESMSTALAYHDSITTDTVEKHQGKVFKTTGDGICAVFESAGQALAAAITIQRLLHKASNLLPDPLVRLKVRIGLYTGTAEIRDNDYFGASLSRVARIMNAAHGGQILLSASTRDQIGEKLPDGVELRDLGSHRLRDLIGQEHLYQALASDFPIHLTPIRSLADRPTNLPAQLTSFVGREAEIQEICRRMRQSNVRLMTLLGAGGIGKTRLSLQVGHALRDEYTDGVFFINLTQVNSDGVLRLIAQTLEIQDAPGMSLLEAIKDHLRERQYCLIFDNFEHVMDSAPLLNDLLSSAARLKVIVTSRESLFIYGEQLYQVPPLALPEPDMTPDQLKQVAAGQLFIERVQAWLPDFLVDTRTAPAVIRICRQLEGLPLALELAAARVHDLTLTEIAEQLAHRLSLLSKGPRDLPSRQQTMRGAIEWSYQLLTPEEQQCFARLAIFDGQFSATAVQQVADCADPARLKNKSLLHTTSDLYDLRYYAMLSILREYAMERLIEHGEEDAMRQKHADYYRQMLMLAEPNLNGRDQVLWFTHLNAEYYNLRAALAWYVKQQNFTHAGEMIGVLWRFWGTQSLLSEGEQWAEQVLAHTSEMPPAIHARVTQGAGRLATLRHQYERSMNLQRTSLALYKSLDDKAGQAAVLLSMGETEYQHNHPLDAERCWQESLLLFRELNDQAGVGRCLNNLGVVARQSGNFTEAEPLMRESLALARAHGNVEGIALALYNLAGVLRAQDKAAETPPLYEESRACYRNLNFGIGVAVMEYNLGYAKLSLGDHVAAQNHCLDALKLLQNTPDEASAIAECLVCLAGAYFHQGRHTRCVRILGAARARLDKLSASLEYADQRQYDTIFSATCAVIDEAQWQAAWTEGQSIETEQLFAQIFAPSNVKTDLML